MTFLDRFPVISHSVALFFFPFIIVLQRCSKLICIKMPYCASIYGKLKNPIVSEDRVGEAWLCSKKWLDENHWGSCEVKSLTGLWFSSSVQGRFLPEGTHMVAPCCLNQGSLCTSLKLLPCTKPQTTNPRGVCAPGPDYLSSGATSQEMENINR